VRGEPPTPTPRIRHTGPGGLRPCDTDERVPGGTGGLAQGARRPDHVARPALLLPLSWRHARRATERLHTLAEPRPTPDGAPGLGATPSQVGQSLLTLAVSSAVFLPAPQAPNAAAQPRLEAGALAQAGRRRLQPVVRHGVSLLVVSGNLLRARLKFCRVGTQILPHL